MDKKKLVSLQAYRDKLKDRLAAEVPNKHVGHPDSYKAFLKNELRLIELKIEAAKLDGVK